MPASIDTTAPATPDAPTGRSDASSADLEQHGGLSEIEKRRSKNVRITLRPVCPAACSADACPAFFISAQLTCHTFSPHQITEHNKLLKELGLFGTFD
jgi:hypothetical protein